MKQYLMIKCTSKIQSTIKSEYIILKTYNITFLLYTSICKLIMDIVYKMDLKYIVW